MLFHLLQVFPELYLPVMTENMSRVLKPWRGYMPSLAQLQHQARVKRLDSYIKQLLRTRWAQRKQNGPSGDILGRIMQGLEVHICRPARKAHAQHAQQDGDAQQAPYPLLLSTYIW